MGDHISDRKQFAICCRFGWRYADFVVCQPYTLDTLFIIEFDDSTHDAHADRVRNAITKAAGFQTIRFQSKQKPTVAELAALFAKILPTLQSPTTTLPKK